MVPRGRVGVIFCTVGFSNNISSAELYAALLIVIVVTTILLPFVLKCFYGKWEAALQQGSD